MKKTITLLFVVIAGLILTVKTFSQPRPIESNTTKPTTESNKVALNTVTAKYEGGMFGFDEKENGTLKFDDENQRIVFYDKLQRERFGIPYSSLQVVSPQSRSVTPTGGKVVSHIPLPGAGLAGLIKEKKQYLVLQLVDHETDVTAVVNFRLADRDLLRSVVRSLGEKAKLTARGDSYYRPRPKRTEI